MTTSSIRGGQRHMTVGMVLSAVALMALSVLLPGVASAHSESGTMTVTRFEQVGPNRVHIEVGLVYEGDEHLAQDADVTATLKSESGEEVGPVALVRVNANSSLYGADIEVKSLGTWTADVTSTEPAATATATVAVESVADTSPPSTSPETTSAQATTPTTTTDSDPGREGGDTTGTGAPDASGDEDSNDPGVMIISTVAAIVFVIVLGLVLTRLKAKDSGSPKSDSGEPKSDA